MNSWYGSSKNFYLVGKVKDAHGIRGELYLLVFSKEMDWLEDLEEVLLEKEHPQAPEDQVVLPIQNLRKHKAGLILKSPQIKDRNAAEALKGHLFYIPTEFLTAEPGSQPYLYELLNFTVIDPDSRLLGEIKGFSSNGAQDLLVVSNALGEFEIPYVDAYIVEADYEARTLKLDLPEGLIERPST